MKLQKVPLSLIDAAWHSGAWKLAEAVQRTDECDTGQLFNLLKSGTYDLITCPRPEAWLATHVRVMPNYRALWVYAIWARRGLSLMDDLKTFARMNDCERIQGACDDTIARLWSLKGFTKAYQVMELKVNT